MLPVEGHEVLPFECSIDKVEGASFAVDEVDECRHEAFAHLHLVFPSLRVVALYHRYNYLVLIVK